MMRSMFAAISGLKAHQVMLDVTAADIANVNTIGYKSSRMTFQDELSQMARGGAAPGPGQGGSNAIQVGLGVQLSSIDNNMQGGAFQSTGNPLDVALQGEGWFRVTSGNPPAPAAGANAGAEVVSTPGGTYGLTVAGALEMSNVDLSAEFTNMITAQRGFQANSRVISTADQMLQDLVNLIR